MHGIFVTGTDTDSGKTRVCAALLSGSPACWRYWKPVQTGLDRDAGDTSTVARFAALPAHRAPDVGVRLGLPVSPHHAAAMVGSTIDVERLVAAFVELNTSDDFWVVEGAGGILTPLTTSQTIRELAVALQLPVLIVVRVRLGAINHALMTAEALRNAEIPVLGFVLSGANDPSLQSALAALTTIPVLGRMEENATDSELYLEGIQLRSSLRKAAQ